MPACPDQRKRNRTIQQICTLNGKIYSNQFKSVFADRVAEKLFKKTVKEKRRIEHVGMNTYCLSLSVSRKLDFNFFPGKTKY